MTGGSPRRGTGHVSARVLVALCVAIAASASATHGTRPASAAPAPAVQAFQVDDAHEIVFEVRLAFWTAGGQATDAQAKAAATSMVRAWEGKKVNCYTLRIKVDAIAVPSYADVPDDRVGVQFVTTPYNGIQGVTAQLFAQSYTRSYIETRAINEDPLSDSPTSRAQPDQGHTMKDPNRWSRVWTNDPRPLTFTHEFGHIIGLNDNYNQFGILPNAVDDVMANNGFTGLGRALPETFTKLARRSGVDTSTLQCSRRIESTSFDMKLSPRLGGLRLEQVRLVARNCDWLPPSSDPTWHQRKNQWSGEFRYDPKFESVDSLDGFDIKPRFEAGGTVEEKVSFETWSYRPIESAARNRWETWESLVLFENQDFDVNGDLQLRQEKTPPKGENFKVLAQFTSPTGGTVMGFVDGQPLSVKVLDTAC